MYAALFDFCAPCPQTKILIFQGTQKAQSDFLQVYQNSGNIQMR